MQAGRWTSTVCQMRYGAQVLAARWPARGGVARAAAKQGRNRVPT